VTAAVGSNNAANRDQKAKRRSKRRFRITEKWSHRASAVAEYVTNLSSVTLDPVQMTILGKGLSYVPTPQYRSETLEVALSGLCRRLRLAYMAYVGEWSNSSHPFRGVSEYVPAVSTNVNLERYIENIHTSLRDIQPVRVVPNFSRREWQALKELRKTDDIVIKKSDKGNNVVILGRETYKKEGLRQLEGPQYCKILNEKFSSETHGEIEDWATRALAAGCMDQATWAYLTRKDGTEFRTAFMYFLPKTHKDPPFTGRPILSGTNSPTERGSAYLQIFLSGIVRKQHTYLKDTGHFLYLYENRSVPVPGFLVALDVNHMYTEIPLDEAFVAVMDALSQSGISSVNGIKLPPLARLRHLLRACLYRNNFMFASIQFVQTRGVPMGSRFSPEVADIVGFNLERRIFAMYDNAIHWSRFRDDCFLLFQGDRGNLDTFLTICNSAHETLKFKWEISDKEIAFLDTQMYKRPDSTLGAKLYRKPAYRFQYLHRNSCHPSSVFGSFIKGELSRVASICSDRADFYSAAKVFRYMAVKRGYDPEVVTAAIVSFDYDGVRARRNTKYGASASLVQDATPRDSKTRRVAFVMPYYPQLQLSSHKSALYSHWIDIQCDPVLSAIFDRRPMIAFRKHSNLGNFLVRARFN
jgi:hypothetical protein